MSSLELTCHIKHRIFSQHLRLMTHTSDGEHKQIYFMEYNEMRWDIWRGLLFSDFPSDWLNDWLLNLLTDFYLFTILLYFREIFCFALRCRPSWQKCEIQRCRWLSSKLRQFSFHIRGKGYRNGYILRYILPLVIL